jgi:tetratricopeptide (TPR) repeat protein
MKLSCLKNSLIIVFTLSIFVCKNGLSQQQTFDSLKALLKTTSVPKERATLLVDIAKSIYINIPDSSIGYCQQAEELSKKYNLDVQLAFSLHCECRYLILKGDIKNSIEKLNKAISIFEKNKEFIGLAKAYSLKAVALGKLHKNKEQIDYLNKSKSIYLKANDTSGISNVLTNLAHAYIESHQYLFALKVFSKNTKN